MPLSVSQGVAFNLYNTLDARWAKRYPADTELAGTVFRCGSLGPFRANDNRRCQRLVRVAARGGPPVCTPWAVYRGGLGWWFGSDLPPASASSDISSDQMEQGPTEPHAGRSTFLLSSGGAGGGYY